MAEGVARAVAARMASLFPLEVPLPLVPTPPRDSIRANGTSKVDTPLECHLNQVAFLDKSVLEGAICPNVVSRVACV